MRSARYMILIGALLALALLGAVVMISQSQSDKANDDAAFCGDEGITFSGPLQVGDRAPDFKLPDHKGGFVRLSDYRDQSNVVLAFFPAAWTPV